MTGARAGAGSRVERLEDHFELGEVLGEGGFGVVFEARRRQDGEAAAIKLARIQLDREMAQRTLREAALAERLLHPRLVRFLGLFLNRDGHLALAYERIQGHPLPDHLVGALPEERWLPWIRDLAEAVDALHQGELIHRDLKAENCMIEPDGRLRLLDFGLLRGTSRGGSLTATGMILGTPVAMAPELFRGELATPASDRYALACVAFQMSQGRLPLEGGPSELMHLHLQGGTRYLEETLRPVSRHLATCFRQALDPEPSRRPPSGGELVRALEEAVGADARQPAPRATRRLEEAPEDSTRQVAPTPVAPATTPVSLRPPEAMVPPPTPRRLPRGILILLGLLGLVAGLVGSRESRLPGSFAEAPRGRPHPPSLQEAMAASRAELEDLIGERMDGEGRRSSAQGQEELILSEDPDRWLLTRTYLPRTRELWDALIGRSAATLTPDELQALGNLEAASRENDLPELFAPFLELVPRVEEEDWEEIKGPALLEFTLGGRSTPEGESLATRALFAPGPVREGWMAVAFLYHHRIRGFLNRAKKALKPPTPELEAALSPAILSAAMADFDGFLERSGQHSRANRVFMRGWLREGIRSTRRVLPAMFRALGEEGPQRRLRLRYFRDYTLPLVKPFLFQAATLPGLPAAFGELPEGPWQSLLAAELEAAWRQRATFFGASSRVLAESLERQEGWLQMVLEAAGEGSGEAAELVPAARELQARLTREANFHRRREQRGPAGAHGPSLPPGLPEQARDEVEALVGERMDTRGRPAPSGSRADLVLAEDPWLWGRSRAFLERTQEVWDRFGQGLDPRSLVPRERRFLEEADALCREQGFPALHAPWMALPLTGPTPAWDPRHFGLVGKYPELRELEGDPWADTALDLIQRLAVHESLRAEEIQEGDPAVLARFDVGGAFQRMSGYTKFVQRTETVPRKRPELRRWQAEGDLLAQRFLLAAGRVLTQESPGRWALAKLIYVDGVRTLNTHLHHCVTLPGVTRVLGGPARSAPARLATLRVLRNWRKWIASVGGPRDQLEEAAELELSHHDWLEGHVEVTWIREELARERPELERDLEAYRQDRD